MASAVDTEKIGSALFMRSYDHDPGATTAVITSADGGTTIKTLDMSDYGAFGVLAMLSVKAGNGITKLEIIADGDGTMDGADVTVIKDSGTVAADAVGDCVWAECTAAEIAQLAEAGSVKLRYVAARLTCHNAGDEAVVTYVGFEPRVSKTGLTANYISE